MAPGSRGSSSGVRPVVVLFAPMSERMEAGFATVNAGTAQIVALLQGMGDAE